MYLLQILLTSLVTGTQVLLLAAGLYLIYTVSRSFHIALGAITMTGAYGYYAFAQMGLPWWICFLAGLLVAAVFGIISFLILYVFVRKGQALLALLMSMSFGVVIESAIGMIFGPQGRFLVGDVLPTFDFFGLHVTQVGVWTILIGLIIAVAAYVYLYLLPYGRVIRAIAQHRECASLVGIKEKRVQFLVFLFVGVLAGIIGILTGINGAITPLAGLNPIIMAFIALLVGGVTDFRGTVAASYLLVLVPEMIIAGTYNGFSFTASWKLVFVFLIALISLSVKPNGLFSSVTRKS